MCISPRLYCIILIHTVGIHTRTVHDRLISRYVLVVVEQRLTLLVDRLNAKANKIAKLVKSEMRRILV